MGKPMRPKTSKKKAVRKQKPARKPTAVAAPPETRAAHAQQPPTGPCCQSCGAPLDAEEKFGKNADGSKNADYCVFCFDSGAFRDPRMRLDRMVEFVAGVMSEKMGISVEVAKMQALTCLPQLKRWRR